MQSDVQQAALSLRVHIRNVADVDATLAVEHADVPDVRVLAHHVLEELLGITAGDVELDVDFLEDPRELTTQVVDDLLVQRLHRNADLQFPRDEASQIADAVITNPHAVLLPADATGRTGPAMRVRFAERVREREALITRGWRRLRGGIG